MYSNILYFSSLNAIGGVESWLYYTTLLYSKYDITIVFKSGDPYQVKRLSKYARCIKWDGKTSFKCDKLFINYNPDIISHVSANEIIFFIHSDYKEAIANKQIPKESLDKIVNNHRITRFVAVSQLAADSFYNLTGIKAEVCYNPLCLEEPRKLIRLCSAQRMTREKGKHRIDVLTKELEKYSFSHNVTYMWDIYTDSPREKFSNRVTFHQPDLNINQILGYYDYFVALSDNEAFCYSAVEALCRGTPCVITPCPVFDEIGFNEKNSIKLDFDCSNVEHVVEQMFNKNFDFKYEPPKDNIENLLNKTPSTYIPTEENGWKVKIKCIRNYFDLQLNKNISPSDPPFEVDYLRAQELIDKHLVTFV